MVSHPAEIESAHVPNLPAVIRTTSGIEFDPRQEVWRFRDALHTIHLDFGQISASANIVLGSKRILVWCAENLSSSTVAASFNGLKHFCKLVSNSNNGIVEVIDVPQLLTYRASLGKNKSWMLGVLSLLFRRWYQLGIPGVTLDAVTVLNQLRIPGMEKGVAVSTMDPVHGPFTDIEFEAIQSTVNFAYSTGKMSRSNYVMSMLFMALGMRPVQYAALKVGDVRVSEATDGSKVYSLRIPRAKQKRQQVRNQFKERVLIPKIGALLDLHANDVEMRFSGILRDPKQAPLFPALQRKYEEPSGFEFHRTGSSISASLSNILSSLQVVSERTGKLINITPYRFRRTIGTRAAMEGHGELVIAELLDHTDTQNVGVYVQATPEIVDRIDRAMAMHLAPLAQAFAGVIIADESEAIRKGDPTSRICDPRFDATMKPLASCGKYGFCGLLKPVGCYTCRNFQPWLDGPHEAVLNFLISERERLLGYKDARIASINDRTILAVAEVVRRCEEIRGETKESMRV
jgi:integrase